MGAAAALGGLLHGVLNLLPRRSIDGNKDSLRGPLAEEIDRLNRAKRNEANRLLETQGDCLPTCDLSVWARDYQGDINVPIHPVQLSGEIPEWLEGTLLRNGPGKQSFGDAKFQHLFDCSAVIHRFKVSKGSCIYQSKLLKSSCYQKNEAAQRIVVTEFGTAPVPDPCKTIFDRISSVFSNDDVSDNCMISVYPFGDQLFTMTEYPTIIRINPATLDTMESLKVNNYVNVVHHTSHPHVTEGGTVYNLGLSVTVTGPKYSIIKFPPTEKGGVSMLEKGSVVAQVPTRWPLHPSYMHTFGLTPNYFVIVEQPLTVSVRSMLVSKLYRNKPTVAHLKWFKKNTLIHVVERNKGTVKTYYAEPFFYLHIINQFEDDNAVIVDICAYKDACMIDCMYFDALEGAHKNPEYANMFRGRPVRFRLPLEASGSTVEPQILSTLGCETPRIDYTRLGKPYRYFYAISSDVDLDNPGTLIKMDTVKGTSKIWNEIGCFPSEPVFVPRPNQKAEDDGLLLSSLLWVGDVKKVSLLILNAEDFVEIGRATFNTPGPVPKCLHGWFTSDF